MATGPASASQSIYASSPAYAQPTLAHNAMSHPAASPHPYSPSPQPYSPMATTQTLQAQQHPFQVQQPGTPQPMQQMQMQQQHYQQPPQQMPQQQMQYPPQQPPPQQQQHQHQHQQQNSMPPPTAPASKPTDPNDLADALTSAGIDLKAEEAQLASFVPSHSGPPSQEEIYQQSIRRQAENRAHHLNNPFLNPRALNAILQKKTISEHCQPFNVIEHNGAISLTGAGADIMTLISLASRERMRDLLTRATALAKARRRPQGVITGAWADQVAGVKPEMRIPDSTSPSMTGQKRSFDDANSDNLVPTANLTNPVALALRALKKKEWTRDQERKTKRARRESISGGSGAPGTPGGTPGPDGASTPIPGTPSGAAPEPGPKLSKEARKQQSSKLEEQISHRAANATANMMMGGLGGGRKKKKTYSWMNAGGAAAAPASPRPGTPGGIGVGVGVGRVGQQGQEDHAADQVNWVGHRIGVWREDGERGKGIQIRDWVGALEADGRAPKKGVYKAYLKLK